MSRIVYIKGLEAALKTEKLSKIKTLHHFIFGNDSYRKKKVTELENLQVSHSKLIVIIMKTKFS